MKAVATVGLNHCSTRTVEMTKQKTVRHRAQSVNGGDEAQCESVSLQEAKIAPRPRKQKWMEPHAHPYPASGSGSGSRINDRIGQAEKSGSPDRWLERGERGASSILGVAGKPYDPNPPRGPNRQVIGSPEQVCTYVPYQSGDASAAGTRPGQLRAGCHLGRKDAMTGEHAREERGECESASLSMPASNGYIHTYQAGADYRGASWGVI